MSLYVVYDKRAKTLLGPIVHDRSEVPIVRQITEAVNSDKPGIVRNTPQDFVILHIGWVDDTTGQLFTLNEDEDAQSADWKPIEYSPQPIAEALALRIEKQ